MLVLGNVRIVELLISSHEPSMLFSNIVGSLYFLRVQIIYSFKT